MPKSDSSGAESVREPGHREGRSLPVYSFPAVLQPERSAPACRDCSRVRGDLG